MCAYKEGVFDGWNDAETEVMHVSSAETKHENHAHWIGTEIEGYTGSQPVYSTVACSHCGFENDHEPAYCEQCGYRMDEVIS